MKSTYLKSFFILVLAMILLLGTACSGAQNTTETLDGGKTNQENEENTSHNTPQSGETEEDPSEAFELLDDICLLISYSDTGLVTEPNACQSTVIKSKNDLEKYRKYLPDLTEELEKQILDDKKGYCILLEITQKGEYFCPSPASVWREGNGIELQISEFEEEEIQPSHTFFLYYISSEFYKGEEVRIVFT